MFTYKRNLIINWNVKQKITQNHQNLQCGSDQSELMKSLKKILESFVWVWKVFMTFIGVGIKNVKTSNCGISSSISLTNLIEFCVVERKGEENQVPIRQKKWLCACYTQKKKCIF